MMKKLISLLLALLLMPGMALCEPLAEESAPLTYEELELYADSLAAAALASGSVQITAGDEAYTAAFPGGTLTIADETLGEHTAVLAATLDGNTPCPRGLKIGDAYNDLMAVYPNDNPTLWGAYYDAALYVAGEKPEACAGWLLRDGQRVTQVNHCVYHWTEEGVTACGVRYDLDQETIVGITLYGLSSIMTEEDALLSLADVAETQEAHEYFAYPKSEDGASLSPFEREDLSFSGMDFLDLTPEMATEALGSADVDEWMADSTGEWLRIRQWDGVSIVFLYDANKHFLRVDTLEINGDTLEGPRGVRVGDLMESVLYRFRHGMGGTIENGVALYGDGQNAPYGVLTYGEETVTINYTQTPDADSTVIWHLTFVGARLQSMRLLLR